METNKIRDAVQREKKNDIVSGVRDAIADPAKKIDLPRVERKEDFVLVQAERRPPTRLPTWGLQQLAKQAFHERPREPQEGFAHQNLRK